VQASTAQLEKFYRARISSRSDLTKDLWVIRLEPGGEYQFVPGQFATLGVESAGKLVQRPYSIVSAPFERQIEFSIELVPGGGITPLLYQLQAGDTILMRKQPKGLFTIDKESGLVNHLLLCTVTGIAPFVSMIRTFVREWQNSPARPEHLYLIAGASRSWEFGYREEMEGIARTVPWLTFIPTVSRPWEDPGWNGETGRVEDIVRKYADLWGLSGKSTTGYLCGHPQMVENGKGILQRHGWAKESLKEEVYWIPGN
jgi:ferredoxin/flavodoxin---NADP+ reductase